MAQSKFSQGKWKKNSHNLLAWDASLWLHLSKPWAQSPDSALFLSAFLPLSIFPSGLKTLPAPASTSGPSYGSNLRWHHTSSSSFFLFPASLPFPLSLSSWKWQEEEMPEITVVHTKQVQCFHGDTLSNIVSVDLALFPFLPQFWSLPACSVGLKACPQGDASQSWGTTVSSAPGKGFKPQERVFFFLEATISCLFPSLLHFSSE